MAKRVAVGDGRAVQRAVKTYMLHYPQSEKDVQTSDLRERQIGRQHTEDAM